MESLYEEITSRNYGVYSKYEQNKLKDSHVCIVGLGCIGGLVAVCLGRLGIGKMTFVDGDKYELVNINRQPMAFRSTVHRAKVDAAKDILYDINPEINVIPVEDYLTVRNVDKILYGTDIVIQCVDDMVSRVILHRCCLRRNIPSIAMSGQPTYRSIVSTLLPGGVNYEELFGIEKVMKMKDEQLDESAKEVFKSIKMERVSGAVEKGASEYWAEHYRKGKAGWAVTTERTYIAGMLQVHECVKVLLGKEPLARAPKAIIIDLSDPPDIIRVGDPRKGEKWALNGHWDYRYF